MCANAATTCAKAATMGAKAPTMSAKAATAQPCATMCTSICAKTATIVPRQAQDEHEASFDLKFKRFRRQAAFADAFAAQVEKQKLDVLICPAHVLPTCPHGTTGDFVHSASYQVRKTSGAFWITFLIENNHFAKTGSGRT